MSTSRTFCSPMTTVLEIACPQCATEILEDEVVALNVETGIYFSLPGLSAALWRDLAAGHPVEALTTLSANSDDAERIAAFGQQLVRYGLMRPATPRPVTAEPTSRALLEHGAGPIVFDVYEDMQDLILSDPIHDVDESKGWPTPRSETA